MAFWILICLEKRNIQMRSIQLRSIQMSIRMSMMITMIILPEEIHIADRDVDRWIRTVPEIHTAISTEVNKQSGGRLKPIIKLVKAWKLNRGIPLKSFHLEVMCYIVETSSEISH